MATPSLSGIEDSLTVLVAALRASSLPLELPGSDHATQTKDELEHQIEDYLLPRLRRLDAPLLAVLGGSTGSGKSTITNSLVGRTVSPSGVLRPTTRSPVLVCHPDDAPWFENTELLPNLARLTGAIPDGELRTEQSKPATDVLRVQPTDSLPRGLAIIDAPDIDSVELANRELATQLLAAADLWLFVTTAVRYADAVPWEFLNRARDRGTALSVVINRVPVGAGTEIVPHLTSMLTEQGLTNVEVFDIEQSVLDNNERLPAEALEPLQTMLRDLAADAQARADIVRATLSGALGSVEPRAAVIHQALVHQDQAVAAIQAATDASYETAKSRLAGEVADGSLLHGEVLDRWQELIGTAELMRAIQSRITRVRNRLGGLIRGKNEQTLEVQGEITSTLEQIVIDHADAVALAVTEQWRQLPGGMQALGDEISLQRHSAELGTAIGEEIRAWQSDILDLVRDRGEGKRAFARAMALGVNGVGVALMIVIFAHTGGISGGEVAVASGTAAVSQTLLNALFGEQAVRDLTDSARQLLQDRLGSLLDRDAARFSEHLASHVPGADLTTALAAALSTLRDEAGQIELPAP